MDTRSDAECEVSMIPCGALRQSDFERRRGEFKDCTVVCYWWVRGIPRTHCPSEAQPSDHCRLGSTPRPWLGSLGFGHLQAVCTPLALPRVLLQGEQCPCLHPSVGHPLVLSSGSMTASLHVPGPCAAAPSG